MDDAHVSTSQRAAEPVTGVMAQLKLKTREHHAAIERVVPLLDAGFDRARYAAYLAVMYRFHREIEQALGALTGFRQALPDFDERRKQSLLARDLHAVGAAMPSDHAPKTMLPPLDDVGQGLGAMYVLEGSTLGGRILSRHLGRTLEITPDDGGAYLASYGEELAIMWRRFGVHVEAWARGRDIAPVIDSARATFACLTTLFTESRSR
jgi:heme oxygenase